MPLLKTDTVYRRIIISVISLAVIMSVAGTLWGFSWFTDYRHYLYPPFVMRVFQIISPLPFIVVSLIAVFIYRHHRMLQPEFHELREGTDLAADTTSRRNRIVRSISLLVLSLAIFCLVYVPYVLNTLIANQMKSFQFTLSSGHTVMNMDNGYPIDGLRIKIMSSFYDQKGRYLVTGNIKNSTNYEFQFGHISLSAFDINHNFIGTVPMICGKQLRPRFFDLSSDESQTLACPDIEIAERGCNTVILPGNAASFIFDIAKPPSSIAFVEVNSLQELNQEATRDLQKLRREIKEANEQR